MRIRHEIAVHPGQRKKFIQQISMALSRLRYPCRFTREPSTHLKPRISDRFGSFEYAGIGDQTQES